MAVTEGSGESEGLVILSCRHNSPLWAAPGCDHEREVMRQCRGTVLERATGRAVCLPFEKFFNVGEAHAEPLDWDGGVVAAEKLDGCLLKLFFWRGRWRLCSNRQLCVDALDGKYACTGRTNRQLFDEAAAASRLDYARLQRNRCYMFERVHPDFKIVVAFESPGLYHLGTRDLHSLAEVHGDDIGVRRPREWKVASLLECRALLSSLDLGEGLVLREGSARAGAASPRRQKLKRPEYVWLHDCSCGGGAIDASWVARSARIDGMAVDRASLNVWLRREASEFAAYYPDLYRRFVEVSGLLERLQRGGQLGAADPRERVAGRFVHEERLWEVLAAAARPPPTAA